MSEASIIDVVVRNAELADAGALAALMCELGYETRAAEMQMRLEPIIENSSYRTFVAVSGGKTCGMIGTFCYYSYEHNDVGGRIVALVVADSMRRRGIGRELIAVAEKDFAQRNIMRVSLNTRFARESAHTFYESLGYTRTGFRFTKNLSVLAD